MSEGTSQIDLDYVLVNELGQFGQFQLWNLLLMTMPLMAAAFFGDYVFTGADLPHRCRIPECDEKETTEFKPHWINDVIPEENSKPSNCLRFAPSNKFSPNHEEQAQCSPFFFNKSLTVACDNYVYEQNNTIVYDFDIGCNEWLRTLPGTLSGIGCLLGLSIGYISDRYGRRLVVIFSMLFTGILGVLRAFSVNFTMYAVLHLLQTTLGSGLFSTAYIMATELTGPKYRMITGTISSVIFALGGVLMGCVAFLIRPWRYLTLALFLPCLILVPFYAFFLTESIRWLLSKQKYSEAETVLQKVAEVNRKEIRKETMLALMRPAGEDEIDISLPSAILSSPVLLRRVCTTPVWWVATTLSFYGLTLNSTSLSDDMYLNYILVSVVEVPGFISSLLVLDRIGRKPVMAGGFFICAFACFLNVLLPAELTDIRLGLTVVAKFGIAVVFNCVYLFTSELYPTNHRHLLLGFSSMIGRIGNIVAPMTPALSQYWPGTPFMLFGVTSFSAGVLALTQPETLGTTLPDTLQQAEALGRNTNK